MDILIFLIPVTFALALVGLFSFMWSLKSKQYDDLEGAANRILFDEDLKNDDDKDDKIEDKK